MTYIGFILASAALLVTAAASPSAIDDDITNTDPLCPYPSEVTTYFANPEDCSAFFECFEGRKYEMKCGARLYWNQDKIQCDYFENVNCNENVALCANEADGTYIADPEDCGGFYECVDHKALGQKCAPGTLWNKKIVNCDFPQNVVC